MNGINDIAAWSSSGCSWLSCTESIVSTEELGTNKCSCTAGTEQAWDQTPAGEIQAGLSHLRHTWSREHPHPCCPTFSCGIWNYLSQPQPRASGQSLPVLFPLQFILGKKISDSFTITFPLCPPSLEYHQIKEKKANQKKMTPKRIFLAGFADNRHRRTELLFAMFLTHEVQQEHPTPGAQPISLAWAMQRHSHSAQFLPGIPGSWCLRRRKWFCLKYFLYHW